MPDTASKNTGILARLRARRERARERRRLLRARWDSLPESQKFLTQWAGRGAISCGATHGVMEKCNYTCTSCYLTSLANWAKPLPYEKVLDQLKTLRKELGHGGKVQITSGEVTLLSIEELGKIVRAGRDLGLDLMVMSNGQRLFDKPDYLPRLVGEFGLEKICCHVDVTQPERVKGGETEADLHVYRDEFAELVRSTRKQTGKALHAAHTVTVTEENLDGMTDVMDWMLRNCDAVRMVSFQPLAEVGRTQDQKGAEASFDAVWERVQRACGAPVNRDAVHFGHEECNATVPLLVLDVGRERPVVVDVIRKHSTWDRKIFARALATEVEAGGNVLSTVGNGLLAMVSQPWTFLTGSAWLFVRGTMLLPLLLSTLMRGKLPRIRPLMVVVHRFMGAEELETDRGKERLEACVFKLPLEDGSLVSMCEMNATEMRAGLTRAQVPERLLERADEHSKAPV
ncbi:MAG: radical SAM protein [Planctomycetota bacterium]